MKVFENLGTSIAQSSTGWAHYNKHIEGDGNLGISIYKLSFTESAEFSNYRKILRINWFLKRITAEVLPWTTVLKSNSINHVATERLELWKMISTLPTENPHYWHIPSGRVIVGHFRHSISHHATNSLNTSHKRRKIKCAKIIRELHPERNKLLCNAASLTH